MDRCSGSFSPPDQFFHQTKISMTGLFVGLSVCLCLSGNLFSISLSVIHCLTVSTAGRVLNRFSKDVGFLDDLLPYTFMEYLVVSRILSVHQLKHKNYVCAFGHFDYLVDLTSFPSQRREDMTSCQSNS